ncbi:hypothetical protein PtA15_5A832 [Puccinia triticina]|uniref:Uncharacterized protein n=1 Tax=Puccinia triticina TaxID=208348 RepID=A0ABY7CLP9_9BASI|nr:uncharacterized protein PtA15_5A832 [Puccinia triticina]WAQ85258.1 hypothetical protein PtA15_5A832 [Puccinia triticina]
MSEMDVIEECGGTAVRLSDRLLRMLKSLANPTAPRTEDLELLSDQPLIQLANLLIPLIKLIKLLFAKISKYGMSYQRLPSHTPMNSDQLKCLCESDEVISDVRLIFINLTGFPADLPDEPINIRLADQNHYQAWFDTWNILFKAAIHNFIQAANQL